MSELPGDVTAVTPATSPTDLSQYTDLSQITDMPTRKQYLEQVLGRYPIWDPSMRAHAGGRPTKCTAELTRDVCALLADGAYIETACAAVGLPPVKLSRWFANAERDVAEGLSPGFGPGESPYIAFRLLVQVAHAQAEQRLLAEIHDARDDKAWARLGWILERTRQGRYGQRQEIRHTHELIVPSLPPQTATSYEQWIEHRSLDSKQIEGSVEAEYEDVTEGVTE